MLMEIWREALIVMGLAAMPISELRGAIPLGIAEYHLSPLIAYGLGVVGSFLPVIPLLFGLDWLVGQLSRFTMLRIFIERLFAYTRGRHSARMAQAGAIGLVALVAIPLPLAGAWSGVLVAFLFGVPVRHAAPLIGLGILIAGLLVTLLTVGALRLV